VRLVALEQAPDQRSKFVVRQGRKHQQARRAESISGFPRRYARWLGLGAKRDAAPPISRALR